MANRFEWAHVTDLERWLVKPDDLAELADDGNEDKDWGLSFSTGSNGCMIFGTLDDFVRLSDVIRKMVQEALK